MKFDLQLNNQKRNNFNYKSTFDVNASKLPMLRKILLNYLNFYDINIHTKERCFSFANKKIT